MTNKITNKKKPEGFPEIAVNQAEVQTDVIGKEHAEQRITMLFILN